MNKCHVLLLFSLIHKKYYELQPDITNGLLVAHAKHADAPNCSPSNMHNLAMSLLFKSMRLIKQFRHNDKA